MRRKFAKKKKIPLLKILIGALLLFLIGSTIFMLFFSSFFKVNMVEVKRDNIACANEENLKETSQILGQNILLINESAVEKKLKEKYLCVKSVKFLRKFPNQLEIEVSGRFPVAQILVMKSSEASPSAILDTFSQKLSTDSAKEQEIFNNENIDKSFLVDSEGVFFSKDTQNLNYPKVYIENEIVAVKDVLKVIEKLKIFGMEVRETRVIGQKILLVSPPAGSPREAGGPKIIFALDNIDIQLASLQLILKKAKIDEVTIEFIDLRFDKPIVRFAPKKK